MKPARPGLYRTGCVRALGCLRCRVDWMTRTFLLSFFVVVVFKQRRTFWLVLFALLAECWRERKRFFQVDWRSAPFGANGDYENEERNEEYQVEGFEGWWRGQPFYMYTILDLFIYK
jgi:hypothetical protein